MFELFVNPWSMAAGVLLAAVPVIIHLINRMRFKRVRWAAMEFVLKAQKRMRRKLIFQQLLLLALRMLLVLLAGVLVGRFLGFNPLQSRTQQVTAHVVILDDSPSMGDGWRGDDGQMTDSFTAAAKVLTEQIAPAAATAATPQTLDLLRYSDLATPRPFGRLNAAVIDEVKTYLAGFRPSAARGSLPAALAKAKELAIAQGRDTSPVVHVLSDFRAVDWQEDGPAVKQIVEELTAAGVKVYLVDVAHPFRKEDKRPPLFHDNLGIVEFRASKAAVARFEGVELLLRVKNFGTSEVRDVRVAVGVNGDENKGQSVTFASVPPGEEKSLKFTMTFDRVGTAEKPLDRFSLVTAKVAAGDPGALGIDNVRHAVVEVRDRLPILVVEGRPGLRDKKEGDGFYLQKMFTSVLGGFAWTPAAVADLEKIELRNYPMVLLLNVPAVSEAAAKKLEAYARDGGGVGIFLGPDVKPQEYNAQLYKNGTGIFPVPLPERPSEPLSDEARVAKLFTLQKKLLLRDKSAKAHPALANMYFDERANPLRDDEFEKFFSFVIVGQYWPVARIGAWRTDPAVTELYCLPNDRPMSELEPAVRQVIDRIPADEPKYAKFKDAVAPLRAQVRKTAASTEPLHVLATLLDRLLSDQRAEGDATEALVREFWAQPEMADLKAEVARLRDAVKFGDPLYLAKQVGKGRVTAVLTTAGETWTDWPTGPGRPSFVPIVTEMERYLAGGAADDLQAVGDPIRLTYDATAHKPAAGRAFITAEAGKDGAARAAEFVDLREQALIAEGAGQVLAFTETAKPGVYAFTATRLTGTAGGADAAEVAEYRAVAVNVDARREGDLKRTGRDDVTQLAPGAELHSPESTDWLDALKQKRTDFTEAGWLFLALLLVLIAEQAMAVKLSFHAGPEDAAPARRPHVPAPEAGA